MDKGRALEYGRPAELLEDEGGAFTGVLRRRVCVCARARVSVCVCM
jgi:hypothetical protein